MNRFKFRVWDKIANRFLESRWNAISFLFDGLWRGIDFYIDQETFDVIQFTTLLDKTGTEIFEGDIIQIDRNGEQPEPLYGAIKWGANGGWLLSRHIKTPHNNFLAKPTNRGSARAWTVVGNIYENNDLLK